MVGGRADEERAVAGAQVAAGADVRGTEDRIADAADQPDVVGDVALAGSDLGQDGAEVRRVGGRAGLAAQAVVHGVEMVADVADVRHRANQAEMLGQLGEPRVQLADAHAGDRRGDRPIRAANFRRAPSGFRSQVSRWLGPPHSRTKMHDFRGAAAEPAVGIDAGGHRPRHAQRQGADAAGLEKLAAQIRVDGCRSALRETFMARPPGSRVVPIARHRIIRTVSFAQPRSATASSARFRAR